MGQDTSTAEQARREGRTWPRAIALLVVTMTTSVLQPSVLLAVFFLLFFLVSPARSLQLYVAAALAVIVTASGPADGLWYVERGWAVLLGGWFAALAMTKPEWRFSSTALTAVLAAGATSAVLIALGGGWDALDWGVSDRVLGGIATFLDAAQVLRDGEALSPAMVTGFYEAAEAQIAVFPALTGIGSMAALGVAWWAYRGLAGEGSPTLGPVAQYRFNDHFVWVFIAGLFLLLTRWSEPLFRVGSNAVVFMGALYTLRGAGVVLFVSGGFSWFGYAMTVMGMIVMTPVVVGAALVIGLGDTWLNVRDRILQNKS